MKLLKLFSLAMLLSFFSFNISFANAQETSSQELANVLVEFEADEIDANSLEIEEPNALPGEFKYNWQLFKENTDLFFTFDKEKKLEKLEKISHRRLIEAKKLAESGNEKAAARVEQALEKYQATKEKISQRLEENPELKEKILERIDANELKHQQVLSTVAEKLKNKVSETDIKKIENIKKTNALNWYNTNQENIRERLEGAIENNNVGSKFKQLKNIATLEELSEILPDKAVDKIEMAKVKAEEKLAEKLENIDSEDKEKLEKYINNIKTPELTKQKFISNLKDSDKLPSTVKEKATNIFNSYSDRMKEKFENLDAEGQKKFLNQFEDKMRSHPANIQFLQNIESTQNRERIQNLLEVQTEGVKEKIQKTSDPVKLKSLERNLKDSPVLKRQIQQRQVEVRNAQTVRPMPSLNAQPAVIQ